MHWSDGLGQVLVQPCRELVERAGSRAHRDLLAADEQLEGRKSGHLQPSRKALLVVDVDFRDDDVRKLALDLLEHWVHGAARTAPDRPEVHEDDAVVREHLVEVFVGQVACHLCFLHGWNSPGNTYLTSPE